MGDFTWEQLQLYNHYSDFWISKKGEIDKYGRFHIADALSYSYMSIGMAFKEFRNKDEFNEYVEFKNKFSLYPEIKMIEDLPVHFFENPLTKPDLDRWLWYIEETLAIFDKLIVKDNPQERTIYSSYPEIVKSWPVYEDFWYYRIKDEYSFMAFRYDPLVVKTISEDGVDFMGFIYVEEKNAFYLFAHFVFISLQRMKNFITKYSPDKYDFWMHIAERYYFNDLFDL